MKPANAQAESRLLARAACNAGLLHAGLSIPYIQLEAYLPRYVHVHLFGAMYFLAWVVIVATAASTQVTVDSRPRFDLYATLGIIFATIGACVVALNLP